jgi:hypothetical protein
MGAPHAGKRKSESLAMVFIPNGWRQKKSVKKERKTKNN